MKIRSLFDLIQDSRDVTDFFSGVETSEQMISRLERLKKREFEEFLICVDALKISVESALEDTLEMSSSGVEGEGDESDSSDGTDDLEDSELDDLESEGEEENPETTPQVENKT